MSEKIFGMSNEKLSGRIIFLAWGIEIIAASVGLFLAISRMIGTDSNQDLPAYMAIQGALPFFAVAVIELTKIPLASVFYAAQTFRWRVIFLISLIIAMGITFETFFIGFDMYQSLLTRDLRPTLNEIKEQKRVIRTANDERGSAESILARRDEASTTTIQNQQSINDRYDDQVDELKRQKTAVLEKYQAKIGPLQASLDTVTSDLEALEVRHQNDLDQVSQARDKATDAALADLEGARDRDQQILNGLRSERQKIIADATQRRDQVLDSAASELNDCILSCSQIRENRDKNIASIEQDERAKLAQVDQKIRQVEVRLSGSGVNTSDVRDQYTVEINRLKAAYTNEKRQLEQRREQLLEKIAIASSDVSEFDQGKLEEIEAGLEALAIARQSELNAEKERFDSLQTTFDEQSQSAIRSSQSVAEANKKLVPLCAELDAAVADNQVYRLAMQIYGSEDACAISEDQLSITKAIWFGSLAIIVSVLGTILALAAFVVRHPPEPYFVSSRPIGDRLRLLFVSIRKRMNAPRIEKVEIEVEKVVEITKEVPVEKVALRDVPVEIVKREVVHIPVYTNDPSLLGKTFRPTEEQ